MNQIVIVIYEDHTESLSWNEVEKKFNVSKEELNRLIDTGKSLNNVYFDIL